MRSLARYFACVLTFFGSAASAQVATRAATPSSSPDDQYIAGPDSLPQRGVPKGKLFAFTFDQSAIYPGTSRKINVYVPAEYTADKPACVYVGLDDLIFRVPAVFDNLIYRHEMPVTIAIGVVSGAVKSADPPHDPRVNRSFEFDGMSDDLARFLLEEVFPEVERHKTPDGLPILLSKDPNDRAAGGGSTGGIGAFTLAWQRPDAFRRVFTGFGTFLGIRGGDRYPALVRKTEPKPIRVFMQDGSHDEWPGGPEFGDWWMGNQTMERALEFAGYEVHHVWGDGTHNPSHAIAVFPDAMRWLWKDWPKPIAAGESQSVFLKAILEPGELWQLVAEDDPISRALSVDMRGYRAYGRGGRVYGTDTALGKVWLTGPNGTKMIIDPDLKGPTGITLSPDGLWLAVAESKTHWGYSYRVLGDGTVDDRQRFYLFQVPDDADDSGAGGWVMDREGRLYGASRMGVQVFDSSGNMRAILPVPGSQPTALSFGGDRLDTLYVRGGDGKTYRRRLKVPGLPSAS